MVRLGDGELCRVDWQLDLEAHYWVDGHLGVSGAELCCFRTGLMGKDCLGDTVWKTQRIRFEFLRPGRDALQLRDGLVLSCPGAVFDFSRETVISPEKGFGRPVP